MTARHNRREVILASGSRTRRNLLQAAGLAFNVVPADIDEEAISRELIAKGVFPAEIARALAQTKAEEIARDRPEALVIGADQTLALGDELFDKPADLAAARECLLRLKGKTHQLHSAVVLLGPGAGPWSHTSTATLTMRDFSDEALDEYLARASRTVCESVGAYQIEGPGIQLFERVEGDHFTILGLPLLPLIEALRARGVLTS